jgi:hypothetical protein
MKVETDLKSGAFLRDAAQTVGNTANSIASTFSNASRQASELTNTALAKGAAIYHILVS